MDSDSLYHDEKVLEIFAELVSAKPTKRRLDALERQEKAAVATAAKREAAAAAEEAKRETAAAAAAAKAAALRETCGAPGSRMCEHRRRRYFCKECGGGGICEHGRMRWRCKDCGEQAQAEVAVRAAAETCQQDQLVLQQAQAELGSGDR